MSCAAPTPRSSSSCDVRSPKQIAPGQGAVVRRGLHLVAVYRDAAGACHERSATCPHLGGVVRWNSAEKSWDCPCHGSRFDALGRVLNGPAVHDLAAPGAPGELPVAEPQPEAPPIGATPIRPGRHGHA